MKLFLQKVSLFFLPFLGLSIVIFSFPVYIAFYTKELKHLDAMIEEQQSKDIIIGTACQNIDALLKYETVKKLKPDIIALGTSRVMQFRREYFTDDSMFYNAGGAVGGLPQYIDFVRALEIKPRFIILGLDQDLFNEDWAKGVQYGNAYQYKYNPEKIIIETLRMIKNKKILLTHEYRYKTNIGLTAMVYGDGFKKDGSYFYNRIINEPKSDYSRKFLYPFGDTMQRIANGNARFEYGNDVWKKSVEQIIELLNECKKHNIEIVAFLPPFAPAVNKVLKENGNYQYLEKIYTTLLPVFDEHGYELYDFTDASHFSDDSMYIDGFHGNDETYHNILLKMKDDNSLIGKYIK